MSVIIRATRPAMVAGRRVEAGETARVSALDAALAVDSGRFVLADETDAAEVEQARRDDVRRAIQQAGQPWNGPAVSPPWQRVA